MCFVDEDETKKLREIVGELLQLDEGLTGREIDFLEDVNDNWGGNFTDGQARWIATIYDRAIGGEGFTTIHFPK